MFDSSDDLWNWTDGVHGVSLNFRDLPSTVAHLKEPLKVALAAVARSSSADHLTALFRGFTHFGRARSQERAGQPIEPIDLADYAAYLGPTLAWRQSVVKLLLYRWVDLGLPGVDAQCGVFYEERRIPGNPKGDAVRTHDPYRGPFTEYEYNGLYKAVNAAYGQGELPLWAMVLARLLFALGARISQYASLKLEDLTLQEGKHILMLPQIKKREEHSRVEFRACELTPQTAALVQELIESEKASGGSDDSPLFSRATIGIRKRLRVKNFDPRFEGHWTGDSLAQRITGLLQPLAPFTERLGYQQTPITTSRFRYTLGTRLAEEGASIYSIAECLGHEDTQNVKSYVEASAKVVDNIDRAMGPGLAPLAQAFRGRLVADEASSTQQGAIGTRIVDFRVSTAGVGSCGGKTSGCNQLKPVACYTCFKFEPWLDAPHDKLLERLEQDRERFKDDPRMAAVNDDAIVAVREVISQCEEVRLRRGSLPK